MKLPRFVICPLSILALGGCASAPSSNSDSGNITVGSGATALLFNYSLASDIPLANECKLTFSRLGAKAGGRDEVTVLLPLKGDDVAVEVPPGRYVGHKLRCTDHRQHDRMENLMRYPIHVSEGKVSYAGVFDFTFDTKASRIMLKEYDSNGTKERLKKTFARLNPETRARLVSAYSGTPIAMATLDAHNDENLGYSCSGPGAVDPRPNRKFKYFKAYGMRKCLKAEVEGNPLTIGRLEYRVSYKARVVDKFEKTVDAHTFSARFVECAERKIKSLAPISKDRLSCEFRF